MKTPQDVQRLAHEAGAQIVQLKFVDLPGRWQDYSLPIRKLDDALFTHGSGFDGSSIRGFQQIHESDMLLLPDPDTVCIDPMLEVRTLSLICNVLDPVTRQPYSRDPRYIAQKAENYLRSSGLADVSFWGAEPEFYIFDDVRYEQNSHVGFFTIDSEEGPWNTARREQPNLGYKITPKQGYLRTTPADRFQDIRSEIALRLEEVGIPVEGHHHECGSAGQGEIPMKLASLTRTADNILWYKYLVRNIARKHNKTATFMPKPLFGDSGSGMHCHQSLWKGDSNLFFDEKGYGHLSQMARYYIGGLLRHAPALLALCAPTTNSYRRLVPGYEAPVNLVYSQRNRSATIRIPVYSRNPAAVRIEFRCPDGTSNPYLCLAAQLMAGLDGIRKKIDPGEPMDRDVYELPPEQAERLPSTPGSLAATLSALEKDHAWLLEGDVFTRDVLNTWIAYKRENEVDPVNLRPVPYEFFLYYDL